MAEVFSVLLIVALGGFIAYQGYKIVVEIIAKVKGKKNEERTEDSDETED